jgi:hypothetical protein
MARIKTISLTAARKQVEAEGFRIIMSDGSFEILLPGGRRPATGQMIRVGLTSRTQRVSPYELRDAIAAARRHKELEQYITLRCLGKFYGITP